MKNQKRYVAHVWLLMPFWRVFSCLLIFTSVLLPLAPLYASEDNSDDTQEVPIESQSKNDANDTVSVENININSEVASVTEKDTSESLEQSENQEITPLPQSLETEVGQNSSDTSTHVVASVVDENTQFEVEPQVDVDNDVSSETDINIDEEVLDDQGTSTLIENVSIDQIETQLASTSSDLLGHEFESSTTTQSETSTTSIEQIDVQSESNDVYTESTLPLTTVAVNDENFYAFGKNECTTMGNGSFYCMNTTSTSAPRIYSGIYVAPDADGDKEIYALIDGVETQVTKNMYDDDAPYFDSISDTIVFHRQIDGRYQIVSYDFETGEETMITSDRFNNMQPYRHDNTIVWQTWIGNDWEIMMLKEEGEVEMLTDNNTQDVTPSVNDTHVVWQSKVHDIWEMHIYNMHSKTSEVIYNTDSSSIQNPRFVLVYDSKTPEGDIETRGYDLKSGAIIELGAETPKLPTKIPDPEQTGEDRALILASQQLKKGESDEQDPIVAAGDDPNLVGEGDMSQASTTGTSTETLVIDQSTITDQVPVNNDLIVSIQDAVPERDLPQDLVIPPYQEVEVPQSTQLEIVPLD